MKRIQLPLVSVIMPVYNGSLFVEKAIDSMLSQTYPRLELLIVDDGSTDNTWKILKSYRARYHKIIKIFRFKKNVGESTAANLAFSKTKGEFVARMDADDISSKNRVQTQVEFLTKNSDTLIVGSKAKIIDQKGGVLGHKKVPLTHEEIYKWLGFINPMIHPSIMIRKSMVPTRNFLYKNTFEATDDYHTYFELIETGRFANIDKELLSYRIHDANKSLNNMKEKFWSDTKVRFNAITHLNYRAPIAMFPAIFIQALIVSILPEKILKEVFFYIRGIKQFKITDFRFAFGLIQTKIKRYAPSFN